MKLLCGLVLTLLTCLWLSRPIDAQLIATVTGNTATLTQVVVVPPQTTPFLTFITFRTLTFSSTSSFTQTAQVTNSILLSRTPLQVSLITAQSTLSITITSNPPKNDASDNLALLAWMNALWMLLSVCLAW